MQGNGYFSVGLVDLTNFDRLSRSMMVDYF